MLDYDEVQRRILAGLPPAMLWRIVDAAGPDSIAALALNDQAEDAGECSTCGGTGEVEIRTPADCRRRISECCGGCYEMAPYQECRGGYR